MNEIKYLLFDAANTLIHKPSLWGMINAALAKNNITVNSETLQKNHKLISELMVFPDRTSAEFYKKFNSELLYSLGIIPNEKILADIFDSCTYLDWEPFEDSAALSGISLPKGIVSNFNSTLSEKINKIFSGTFSHIITSEEIGCAKPADEFYAKAIAIINEKPENILYVGDSIKLDMEPALKSGMKTYLIDRINCFPGYPDRIASLYQLPGINN